MACLVKMTHKRNEWIFCHIYLRKSGHDKNMTGILVLHAPTLVPGASHYDAVWLPTWTQLAPHAQTQVRCKFSCCTSLRRKVPKESPCLQKYVLGVQRLSQTVPFSDIASLTSVQLGRGTSQNTISHIWILQLLALHDDKWESVTTKFRLVLKRVNRFT